MDWFGKLAVFMVVKLSMHVSVCRITAVNATLTHPQLKLSAGTWLLKSVSSRACSFWHVSDAWWTKQGTAGPTLDASTGDVQDDLRWDSPRSFTLDNLKSFKSVVHHCTLPFTNRHGPYPVEITACVRREH